MYRNEVGWLMSVAISVERTSTALELTLTVEQEGVGGVSGLTGSDLPTAAIRNGFTTDSYLDFGDLPNFKTSGWATKYVPLVDVERGHYRKLLDVSALAVSAGDLLIAEFHVDNGGSIVGDAHDVLEIVSTVVPPVLDVSIPILERPPPTSSFPYKLSATLRYGDDVLIDADSDTISVSVENEAGTSRNANLDSTTMTKDSVGRYSAIYNVSDSHEIEEVIFSFVLVVGSVSINVPNETTTVLDSTEADDAPLVGGGF